MSWFRSLISKNESVVRRQPIQIFFTNTLSGNKEVFIPLKPSVVLMYSCGPTVYGPAHIGNLRGYVFSDTLARTLKEADYRVQRVINITDVGHLVGDGDTGEDKVTLGAEKEHTTPEAIATRYTKQFIEDLDTLNIDTDEIRFPRATEYIQEQIALAKTLEEKGFTYKIESGLYFDVKKFPGYGKLGNLAGAELTAGARVELAKGKRHASDFVLWRAAKPKDLQQWDSPWGKGNPGWHLECSAMIRSILGLQIDIHTGGEDLAMIHHNDEIAQSEAATGRPFVRYWLHNAFVTMTGEKASKSLGNVVYVSDIISKNLHPLSLRYFFLQAHYRTPLSFSWDALAGAQNAIEHLWKLCRDVAEESNRIGHSSDARENFLATMRDDLATSQALGVLWETLRSEEYTPEEKWGLIETADAHFGLELLSPPLASTLKGDEIPEEVKKMLTERENARSQKDFKEADRMRSEIEKRGYSVEDGPNGAVLTRTTL